MALKHALLFIILLSFSKAFACECANVFNNSFLGNTDRFDFIVKGKIIKEDFDSLTLQIEEIYKGEIKKDTIFLGVGFGCDNLFTFKEGDKIITGLQRFDSPDYPNTFIAPGCVTSAVYVKGKDAYAPVFQLPMFNNPKISIFRSKMDLHALERKIRRKVG